jgi:hypothetical protein
LPEDDDSELFELSEELVLDELFEPDEPDDSDEPDSDDFSFEAVFDDEPRLSVL